MRKPERLFLLAALTGLIIGKLIKNFKWGFLLGILLSTLVAFSLPSRKKKI